MTAADHHVCTIVETAPAAPGFLPHALQQVWRNEDETRHFADCLARQAGLRHCFVILHGDLGAGKTTLVRHLLRALGVTGRIKSPTYAVVEPHQAPGLAIWHFDFYRFGDPREWEDAGFRDIFASDGLKLAEWPDNAAAALPSPDIAISLRADDDAIRHATIESGTPRGQVVLQGIRQCLSKTP